MAQKVSTYFDIFYATSYVGHMTKDNAQSPSARTRHKEDVRSRILDSLIALLGEGTDINHDRVAERAGVARRTVYRYFPDQAALMQPLWDRVVTLAGPGVTFPKSMDDMLASLPVIYRGFDAIAGLATIVRSTPQGRAVRLAQKDRRRASYTEAVAPVVRDLSPEDQMLATAMLAVLHTTPWLEFRDQWELSGDQMARACGWAMSVLLKDLQLRGDKPLAEGVA
jgi:AcrR family transcriptional regulator